MRVAIAIIGIILVVVVGLFIWGIGVNNQLVQAEQGVNEAWAQVENVYQRRADLIPNLVETVKGSAAFEREHARGGDRGAGEVDADARFAGAINDPAAFAEFQAGAGRALDRRSRRLMVVVERYPELKANQNFRDLQAQLEGTENRIAVERRRFNEVARAYNTRAPAASRR